MHTQLQHTAWRRSRLNFCSRHLGMQIQHQNGIYKKPLPVGKEYTTLTRGKGYMDIFNRGYSFSQVVLNREVIIYYIYICFTCIPIAIKYYSIKYLYSYSRYMTSLEAMDYPCNRLDSTIFIDYECPPIWLYETVNDSLSLFFKSY